MAELLSRAIYLQLSSGSCSTSGLHCTSLPLSRPPMTSRLSGRRREFPVAGAGVRGAPLWPVRAGRRGEPVGVYGRVQGVWSASGGPPGQAAEAAAAWVRYGRLHGSAGVSVRTREGMEGWIGCVWEGEHRV